MILQEWKQLFRKACENEYEYLEIDRSAKIEKDKYTIKKCNKTV